MLSIPITRSNSVRQFLSFKWQNANVGFALKVIEYQTCILQLLIANQPKSFVKLPTHQCDLQSETHWYNHWAQRKRSSLCCNNRATCVLLRGPDLKRDNDFIRWEHRIMCNVICVWIRTTQRFTKPVIKSWITHKHTNWNQMWVNPWTRFTKHSLSDWGSRSWHNFVCTSDILVLWVFLFFFYTFQVFFSVSRLRHFLCHLTINVR